MATTPSSSDNDQVDASLEDAGIPVDELVPDSVRIECDAVGCRELASYRLEAVWISDDVILIYVCLVHMTWGFKELRAFRIGDEAPYQVLDSPVDSRIN